MPHLPPSPSLLHLAPALLFSWFAVLSLFAANVRGTTAHQVILPLLATTLAILLLQCLIQRLRHSWPLTGMISLVLVVTFFSFNHVQTIFSQWLDGSMAIWAVWILYLILAAGILFIAFKRPSWPSLQLVKILSLIGLVLVISPTIQIISSLFASSQARHQAFQATQNLPKPSHQPSAISHQPDIYYIILDRYASPQTQSEFYNYDSQPLLDYLADHNFYWASQSRTNYPKTLFSLSSALNLDYLQNVVDTTAPGVSDADTASTLLLHHKFGQLIKQQGYTYYHIGNSYELAATPEIADVNVMPNWTNFLTTSSFSRQLLNTTYYPEAARLFTKYPPGLGFDQQYNWVVYQRQQLLQSVNWSGPKFVMAHLLMPHDPYVFNADCSQRTQPLQRWEIQVSDYIAQLQCANQLAMETIQNILDHSDNPPIIILQSDEGPEAMIEPTGHHWKFAGVAPSAIKERTQILNAYYFPDQNYDQLYPSITPINTFRTILRQYFAFDLPNLPDTTYLWPDKDHLFDFYPNPPAAEPLE